MTLPSINTEPFSTYIVTHLGSLQSVRSVTVNGSGISMGTRYNVPHGVDFALAVTTQTRGSDDAGYSTVQLTFYE